MTPCVTHGPRRARGPLFSGQSFDSLDRRVLSLARWQGPADTSAAPVHLTVILSCPQRTFKGMLSHPNLGDHTNLILQKSAIVRL